MVGAVEIGRHHRDEIAAMLPAVGLAEFEAGDLGDGTQLVGWLEWAGQEAAHRYRLRGADRCRMSLGMAASRRRCLVTPRSNWLCQYQSTCALATFSSHKTLGYAGVGGRKAGGTINGWRSDPAVALSVFEH
jgi:hypothetical protein